MKIVHPLIIVGVFGFFYLLGSFIALSLDPAKWGDAGRFIYVFISVIMSLMSIAFYETFNDDV